MNIVNNKRKRESQERIENIFIDLIQTRDINEISVSEICKKANLNRSTFYANYVDVYDLADKIRIRMMNDVLSLYVQENATKQHSYDFLKLFKHIKDNKIYYKLYFKLGFDNFVDGMTLEDSEMIKWYGKVDIYPEYHIAFFKAGLNAIIKKWLSNDCKESPEDINNILISEYKKMKN